MLRDVSLRWKLFAVTGVLLAVVTVQTILGLSAKPNRDALLMLVGFAYLVGGAMTLVIVRRLTAGVRTVIARMDAVDESAKSHLMRGLEALAADDLTVELHAGTVSSSDFAGDELGQIMRHTEMFRDAIVACYGAYNETAAKLRSLMGTVMTSADSLSAASQEMSSISEVAGRSTDQIAQAITGVAEGAERQARMAETAQRSAQEIASAVSESADNAERTAEMAHNAHQVAQQGVAAAEQANEAMRSVRESSEAVTAAIGELAGKSEQIGQIVETITAISEQTNLLALNAAIEAARAGEQGRGFAVVAEEVRKLAEDSRHAAREISELIASMQGETAKAVAVVEDGARRTQDGATVVEQTREAFLSIGQAVEEMTGQIEQIAAAAQQIAASATGMQQNVGEVAGVAEQSSASTQEVSASAQQTSASAQQIAASAQQLAANAETLDELVAQFKLTS